MLSIFFFTAERVAGTAPVESIYSLIEKLLRLVQNVDVIKFFLGIWLIKLILVCSINYISKFKGKYFVFES